MSAQHHTAVVSFDTADWYAVYLKIAECDHQWRIRALYGDTLRPSGHIPFRPLPLADFTLRYEAAMQAPGGREAFVSQMLRRAYYYRVDVMEAAQAKQAA